MTKKKAVKEENAVQVTEPKALKTVEIKPDQYALIKSTTAKGATDDEFKMYLYQCQRRNVHPLDKLIHFVKFNNTVSFITSIDLYRIKAYETGLVDGIICEEIKNAQGQLYGASCKVYRKDMRFPIVTQAVFKEYSTGRSLWAKMPSLMIKKCAEALALRQAFPDALHGLYISEEMDQAREPVKGEYIEPAKAPPKQPQAPVSTPKETAPTSEPTTPAEQAQGVMNTTPQGYTLDDNYVLKYSTFEGKKLGDLEYDELSKVVAGIDPGNSWREKLESYIEKRFQPPLFDDKKIEDGLPSEENLS